MAKISIFQLMRINPNSNITFMRIWDDDDEVFRGMMDKCPKEYLHRPISEIRPGEFEFVVFF